MIANESDRVELALTRVDQGWHMVKDSQLAMAEDARVLANEVRRLRRRLMPVTQVGVFGSVVAGVAKIKGASCERQTAGSYRFTCANFDSRRSIVSVQIHAPWSKELTAFEVEMCTLHPLGHCPDDIGFCNYDRRVVQGPRYMAVVVDMKTDGFTINVWRAPKAPADGTKAIGETELADVDFDIQAVRFA